MTSPEKLEQEAEKHGISASTERCLGNCATCAYACSKREQMMEISSEDSGEQVEELESSMETSSTSSLRPRSPEEIVKSMRERLGDDRINLVLAEYLRQIKPTQTVPQSNYKDKRNHFQIPA
ncbi:hypothetical protein FWH09_03155 [Candidatus Saccharibacteria bacterium]|nr:hypothetical protein [Candidatus Saccharibacteria bacterium]